MTPAQITAFCPGAERFAEILAAEVASHGVKAEAMFLAQVAHESGGFIYTRELWGPTPQQAGYVDRSDLGNTLPSAIENARAAGDDAGHFYAGHGLIQVTGYLNHLQYSMDRYGDDRCAKNPRLLIEPLDAVSSAVWFWTTRHCDNLARGGNEAAFEAVTRRINGGLNGLAERKKWWERAKGVLA